MSEGNLKTINKAIVDAKKSESAIAALKALDEVPGIGLATATAILTVCYPDTFTIIDERVTLEISLVVAAFATATLPRSGDQGHPR